MESRVARLYATLLSARENDSALQDEISSAVEELWPPARALVTARGSPRRFRELAPALGLTRPPDASLHEVLDGPPPGELQMPLARAGLGAPLKAARKKTTTNVVGEELNRGPLRALRSFNQ